MVAVRKHRRAWLFGTVCAGLVALYNQPVWAAVDQQAIEDEIRERLEGAWYEIEIVVFERLRVLDFNAPETLTLRKPRRWPRSLVEIEAPLPVSTAPLSSSYVPYCVGYPDVAIDDPPFRASAFGDRTRDATEALAAADAQPDTSDTDARAAIAAAPTPGEIFQQTLAAFEASLQASSHQPIPNLTMLQRVKYINRRAHLRPVIHLRWHQAVADRNTPEHVVLRTNEDPTLDGTPKILGHVRLSLGRYLHTDFELWYHGDALGWAPKRVGEPAPALTHDNAYMRLKQTRRLRSRELHYIDHPKMGVLVQIDPIGVPQQVTDAWLRWKNTEPMR